MKTNYYLILVLFFIGGKAFTQENNILYKKDSLKIYKSLAMFKCKEIYNAEKDLQELIKKEEMNQCQIDYTFYYNPLSLVDIYYSYEYGEYGEFACGVPGNVLGVKTINLNSIKEVSLTEIFTEESILKALKADKWIKQIQNETTINFSELNSFLDFLKAINETSYAKFKPYSFTVLKYNYKKGDVSVRFVGQEYMGFNHNKHLQLGLRLKPKQEFEDLFKRDVKFTLGSFDNGLKNK